jgi:hypothetical protein
MSFSAIQSAVSDHSQAFAAYLLKELGQECEDINEYYEAFNSGIDNDESAAKKPAAKKPAAKKPAAKKSVAKKSVAKKSEEDSEEEKSAEESEEEKSAEESEEEKPKKKSPTKGRKCVECGGGIRTAGEDYCSKHRKKSGKKSAPKPVKKNSVDKPKKARSGYMIFCAETRELIKEEMPELKGSDTMTELGSRWSALEEEEKDEYKQKALAEKELSGGDKTEPKQKSTKSKKPSDSSAEEESTKKESAEESDGWSD